MNASIDVAVRLEELFDRPFTAPMDVMEGAEEVRDAEPTPTRRRRTRTTSTSSAS
ncbi:hypothetical protein SY89_00426 [Halolamina pelagica]|uniref:Uncharacterized protein n=1 Tax=Halolamina pelagica TaxID=699431 RepID=A0A0P7GW04_9EURY|nr:hypothetical protein SY89_00426 [Halolamina pelagica]